MGPVMAEPFISPFTFTITPALSSNTMNVPSPPPCLPLTDHNTGHHLLTQLGLTLLHSAHHHVAHGGGGQSVQTALDALHGDDVQVLGTAVVGTVHHTSHVQGHGCPELVSGCATTTTLGHCFE